MDLKPILTAAVAGAAILLSQATGAAADDSAPTTSTVRSEQQSDGKKSFRGGVLGMDNALVTVAEYGDLQCPNSARAAVDYFPRIERDFLTSIRYEFRAFPHDFHPQAVDAEVAARCAGEQGKYVEFRNRLLADQGPVTPGSILGLAGELSLDTGRFRECVGRGDHAREIRQQKTDAETIGVHATPTYAVFTGTGDGERTVLVKNPKSYDEIRSAIEEARRETVTPRSDQPANAP